MKKKILNGWSPNNETEANILRDAVITLEDDDTIIDTKKRCVWECDEGAVPRKTRITVIVEYK